MAKKIFIGGTSGDGGDATNWNDAIDVVSGDTVIFNDQSTRGIEGAWTAPPTLTACDLYMVVEKGFNFYVGSSGSVFTPQTIPTLIFMGGGVTSSYIAFQSATGLCYVDTQSTKDNVLVVSGSLAHLSLKAGKISLASSTTVGTSCAISGVQASACELTIPASCTITPPLNLSGGKVTTASSIATVNVYSGTFIFDSSAVASTRLNVFGGEVIWDSTGTMALIEVYGGTFRTRVTRASRTVTNLRVYSGGIADFSTGGWNITFSNAPRVFGTGVIKYPAGFGVTPSI